MISISNYDDFIDSRDVIARIKELNDTPKFELDDDEATELRALEALADEASGYAPDWEFGETLIRDSYFVEYAQEFAEDIGAIEKSDQWPNYCIDWNRAARELQMDYTSVDFAGVTYWVR